MRKRQIMIAAIKWCLAVIFTIILLPGCARNDVPMKIPVDIDELSLVDMWNDVRIVTGIKKFPAYLHNLKLEAFKHEITRLSFNFIVYEEPDWIGYLVTFDERGELVGYNFDEIDFNPYLGIPNPEILFAEIDKYGLTNIRPTVSGFTIFIETGFGHTYNADGPFPLYHLKDGTLTPLKYVKFGKDQPNLDIQVGSHAITRPRENIYETYENFEYWLLSEDLAKAEIVEYQDN